MLLPIKNMSYLPIIRFKNRWQTFDLNLHYPYSVNGKIINYTHLGYRGDGDKGDPGTTDYNGLQNKPVVNGAVTAYQSDIMKSQLRNVTFSTEEPKTTDGKPGDMWVVYGDE